MESAASKAKVGQTMQKKKIKGRPVKRGRFALHASLVCGDINKDLITAVIADLLLQASKHCITACSKSAYNFIWRI